MVVNDVTAPRCVRSSVVAAAKKKVRHEHVLRAKNREVRPPCVGRRCQRTAPSRRNHIILQLAVAATREDSMKCNTLLLLLPLSTGAFLFPCERRAPARHQVSSSTPKAFVVTRHLLSAKKDKDDDEDDEDDDDDDDDSQTGMKEAFRELDALKSLDDGLKKKSPGTSRKPIENVNVEPSLKKEPKASMEEEVKLYKDMMNESEKEDVELYADMMTDMGGTPPKPKRQTIKVEEEERVELLDSLERSPEDLDVFMNQALQEALKEAKSKSPEELASIDPLDDEKMMDDIRQVFEKANAELLASLEVIRKEQVRTWSCRVHCRTLSWSLSSHYYTFF